MIKLFDIQDGKVLPTEHCYTMGCFKDIIDTYPEDHTNILAYLFYMSCPNEELNPFFDVPEHEKEELIRREVRGDFDSEDDLVQYALGVCKQLYDTPTYRVYVGIKIFLDNMARSLATEQLTYGRDGNSQALLRMAEKFEPIRQSYKGAYKDLQEEQSRGRGGQDLAYDQ